MWRWLRAQEPLPAHASLTPLAAEVMANVNERGKVTVRWGAGAELTLEGVFAPSPWGPSAVKIGAELRLAPAHRTALLELAAHQLDGPFPSPTAPASPPASFLVSSQWTRARLPRGPGLIADVQLFELDKPRVRLDLVLAFDDRGAGWLAFRGPRGKKSRALVLTFLALHLPVSAELG